MRILLWSENEWEYCANQNLKVQLAQYSLYIDEVKLYGQDKISHYDLLQILKGGDYLALKNICVYSDISIVLEQLLSQKVFYLVQHNQIYQNFIWIAADSSIQKILSSYTSWEYFTKHFHRDLEFLGLKKILMYPVAFRFIDLPAPFMELNTETANRYEKVLQHNQLLKYPVHKCIQTWHRLFHLVIQWYPTSPNRREELYYCLERNILNEWISNIWIFCDPALKPNVVGNKVHYVSHFDRLTFKDVIAWTNTYLPGENILLANTDIYFDNSLSIFTQESWDFKNKFVSLTRYEKNGNSIQYSNNTWSSDVWIWESPIREFGNFPLGIPFCDTRIVYEAQQNGYVLYNPSVIVYSYHLHTSNERTWKWDVNYIPGKCLELFPTQSLSPCHFSPVYSGWRLPQSTIYESNILLDIFTRYFSDASLDITWLYYGPADKFDISPTICFYGSYKKGYICDTDIRPLLNRFKDKHVSVSLTLPTENVDFIFSWYNPAELKGKSILYGSLFQYKTPDMNVIYQYKDYIYYTY